MNINYDEVIEQSVNIHSHNVYSDQIISREVIRSSLKKKTKNNLQTRLNKLIHHEL